MIFQSFRYWIADKLTGGALRRADDYKARYDRMYQLAIDASFKRNEAINKASAYHAALRTIAAMPTPSANATVRRMAAVAQKAVEL